MLILFFDTFISSGEGDRGGSYQCKNIENALSSIRDTFTAYKWQKKIDVVRYTLASYANIQWDKVIIRFECEDKSEEDSFENFCAELFPLATIERRRSATAFEYSEALKSLTVGDDAWIFFSPNNDHPFLGKPDDLQKYICLTNEVASKNPDNDVALLYSHFTESILDNYPTDPQWGYFGFRFKKVIKDNELAYITRSNLAPLDSIQVFRLGYLKKLFAQTQNKGRVIRLEDLEFCASVDHNMIQIHPKIELCRHYDGYFHLMKYVPPLFIPDGFFEKTIKIRYGYDTCIEGWVSINPLSTWLTQETNLPIVLDDIPYFWHDRITEVDINPNFIEPANPSNLTYYKNFNNPWHKNTKIQNLVRSGYIYFFKQGQHKIRLKLRSFAIAIGIFSYLRNMKYRKTIG